MSTNVSSTIATLNLVSDICSRYCLAVLLLLGLIGLTLNTLIFTRKMFRQNSCVRYFLASTIANYFVIYFILPSRILSDGFSIDPGTYNLFYCKLRFYTYFTAKSLSSWFIVLACFDRIMSSSRNAHYRAFSRLVVSRWMISGTTIAGILFYAHVLVFYEIDQNKKCNPRAGMYRLINDGIYLIGYSITPPLLMLIFSVGTIRNTKRFRRVGPQSVRHLSNLTKRDHALMLMVLFEVILITVTALPHAVQKLYSTLTADVPKDSVTKASDNLFTIVVRAVSFFNHSCSFYILTLSGQMFREELFKLLREACCLAKRPQRMASVRTTN
jgi:magnesium-transporting ATPase (P-type)